MLNRLSPLLPKHKLCILPRVLERLCTDRLREADILLVNVALRVSFDLVSMMRSSSHSIEAFGEALDAGANATAKAVLGLQARHAPAVLRYCRADRMPTPPVTGSRRVNITPEPLEDWEQWAAGIADVASSCATHKFRKLTCMQ